MHARVLQIIPDLGGGGAERMLLNLATQLDRSRFEVAVLSLYASDATPVETELVSAGIRVAHLAKRVGFDPRMFWRIRRYIESFDPTVIHTHRAVLQYALPSLILRRRCAVHTVHNLAGLEAPRVGRAAHSIAFALGVAPVAIGAAVAESFTTTYRRVARATIANGIPVERYASPQVPRALWRRRERVNDDQFVFVCAARLQPQKNVGLLLRALRLMLSDVPHAALLLIAGDGPQRRELELAAKAYGIGSHVRFLGARSDMPAVLGAADAFVLSSDWEGNPLAVMEAMAAGLPVIATRVGGVPEIVEHGATGILVPASDEEALAAAMSTVLNEPDVRRQMSIAARRRAFDEFDVAVMARRYAALYEELLSRRPRASSPAGTARRVSGRRP